MKQIKEWFEELPEKLKEKAIKNLQEDREDWYTESLSNAILFGFKWNETEEGEDFWNKLNDELIKENK